MATLASKRKRDSHDMPNMRAAPGMSVGGHDFDPQYFQGDGMDGNMDFAAVLAQHNADPSGNVEEEEQDVEDVGQLQHQQQHQHQQQQQLQTGGGAGPSASDTAAAAMAQYHTMTVPQSTEQSFLQQQTIEAAGERQGSSSVDPASAQQRTSSFDDFNVSPMKEGQSTQQNGETSPTADPSNPNGPKPAVGSDEWHKVRRDNHKEGT